jgi:hypothetical protein
MVRIKEIMMEIWSFLSSAVTKCVDGSNVLVERSREVRK